MTSMSYSMAQMRWSTDLVQTLKTNGYLKTTNTALTKYGVGVQINNVGLVTIAVVFSAWWFRNKQIKNLLLRIHEFIIDIFAGPTFP